MSPPAPKTKLPQSFALSSRARLFGGIALAMTCFGPMPSAHALALGELTVTSNLGQYLDAEVELLSIKAGQEDLLIARLADDSLYTQFKIPRISALSDLRFKVDVSDPKNAVVRIQSVRPINEPFLNILLAIEGPSGTIVREIAILLDPIVFTPRATLAATPTETVAEKLADAPTQAAALPESESTTAKLPAAQTLPLITEDNSNNDVSVNPGTETFELWVNRGDTLMELASAVTPLGVTVEQATVAMYQNNPHAFRGSIHRLRHSVVLVVPTAKTMAAVSQRNALAALRSPNRVVAPQATTQQVNNAQSTNNTTSGKPKLATVASDTKANLVDDSGTDWGDYFDVDVDLGATSESAVAALDQPSQSATERVAQVSTVVPTADELIEMRSLIAALEIVLSGLDSSVSEKILQLQTIDRRVVELQASFNDIESRIKPVAPSSSVASAVVEKNIPEESKVANTSAPVIETKVEADSEQVNDTETLAAVLLDPSVIDDARADGSLAQLVEEAKQQALSEAIDRGAVSEEPDVELVSAEVLKNTQVGEPLESALEPKQAAATPEEMSVEARESNNRFSLPATQFTDNMMHELEVFMADQARVEKFRKSLLNGGLILIAGTMLAFLYRRWSWRREVQQMEEELNENKPVDTSRTLEYYHSTLDGEELQEETLKEALRMNRAAHDVRLQLLQFYASKENINKFSECAKDMYRLTRGRVPEWQHVIEMGLKLDPNMNFYDVDDGGETNLIQRNEVRIPLAQAGFDAQDDVQNSEQPTSVASKVYINELDQVERVETVLQVDPNADVEVHFNDDSLVDYAERQFGSDDNDDFSDLADDEPHSSQRDFTRSIDLVDQHDESSRQVDLNLFDDDDGPHVQNDFLDLTDETDSDLYTPANDSMAESVTRSIDTIFTDEPPVNQGTAPTNLDADETQGVDEGTQRDMELKLVLARAYIENRFLKEASSLLDEVALKGTIAQQVQANVMMRELKGGGRKKRA